MDELSAELAELAEAHAAAQERLAAAGAEAEAAQVCVRVCVWRGGKGGAGGVPGPMVRPQSWRAGGRGRTPLSFTQTQNPFLTTHHTRGTLSFPAPHAQTHGLSDDGGTCLFR